MWQQRPLQRDARDLLAQARAQLCRRGEAEGAALCTEEEGSRAGAERHLPHQGAMCIMLVMLPKSEQAHGALHCIGEVGNTS